MHIERDITAWRRIPRAKLVARQHREKATHYPRSLNCPLATRLLKHGVLDGTIPSAVSDTGATFSTGLSSDGASFCAKGQRSTKIFCLPDGSDAPASEVRLLQQPLRDPARTIDMVPSLRGASLLSTNKLANAGYVTVYDEDEVNVYNGRTVTIKVSEAAVLPIKVSEAAVLQRWQCTRSRLWQTPLTSDVKNTNTDTLLLNSPNGRNTVNAL